MKKLTYTKKEAIQNHRKMWNWLAKHPTADKSEYFQVFKLEKPKNECYACHYSFEKQQQGGYYCSEQCILVWPEGGCLANNTGLFFRWHNCKTLKEKAKYAKQIATLPERQGTNIVRPFIS